MSHHRIILTTPVCIVAELSLRPGELPSEFQHVTRFYPRVGLPGAEVWVEHRTKHGHDTWFFGREIPGQEEILEPINVGSFDAYKAAFGTAVSLEFRRYLLRVEGTEHARVMLDVLESPHRTWGGKGGKPMAFVWWGHELAGQEDPRQNLAEWLGYELRESDWPNLGYAALARAKKPGKQPMPSPRPASPA